MLYLEDPIKGKMQKLMVVSIEFLTLLKGEVWWGCQTYVKKLQRPWGVGEGKGEGGELKAF